MAKGITASCHAPGHGNIWGADADMQTLYVRKAQGKGWARIGLICGLHHIKLDNPQVTAAVVNQPELAGLRSVTSA